MKKIYISVLVLALAAFAPSATFGAMTAASLFTHVATPVPCTVLTTSFGKGAKDTATNTQVSRLQKFLAAKGYFTASATGYFGTVTEASVKTFQKSTISGGKTIPATGYVGSITRAAIQAASCSGTGTTQTTTTTNTGVTTSPICPPGYTCDVKK